MDSYNVFYVLFILFVCLFWRHDCSKICLSCSELLENEMCHNAIQCRENEVCFTQKYQTMDNRTLYDVGCSYPELCRKNTLGVVFGRRSGDRGHILCHRCCDESVCNAHTTCDDDSNDHKLQCLFCSGVESVDKCNRNITCATNEVCFMQKYQATLNKTLFDFGCKRSTMCTNRLQSNVLGRSTEEEKHLLCETCCNGDSICNRDLVCSHHNLASINDSCSSTSDCMSNLICKSEKCTCPIDDYYWSINTCKNKKLFNAVCKSSDECFDSLYCNHGICKCDRIDYWGGQKCYRRKNLHASCQTSSECQDTLHCINGSCSCFETDYDFWNGTLCVQKKGVGQGCYYSNDCKLSLLCLNHTCKCNESHSWNGTSCKLAISYPSECADIYFNSDGVFNIYPYEKDNPVPVFCKLENGTRWTVIQRRTNGLVDFYRTWNEYKKGFGSVYGEYWLGNDNIHLISTNGRHKIHIEMMGGNGSMFYADYSIFSVQNETSKYLLHVTGYSGNAGDNMDNVEYNARSNGAPFSTRDRNNGASDKVNCANNDDQTEVA
ncbi:uncharacterized protein LOC143052068 [Mytilus galloprovincialis]|uniref:uncharacterized protein LOC143052068 n=1 Tax=Mytilus galloprovincialis TaxID=29158 RepID=UPI003F7C73AC